MIILPIYMALIIISIIGYVADSPATFWAPILLMVCFTLYLIITTAENSKTSHDKVIAEQQAFQAKVKEQNRVNMVNAGCIVKLYAGPNVDVPLYECPGNPNIQTEQIYMQMHPILEEQPQ